MPATSVQLEGVEKRFGSVVAVHALDLVAEPGEFLVLLGPSGCGKSTVLRLIAGLEAPSAGRILIGATDVTAVDPRDRDVAMVFQSYALYPHLSVRRNIEFPLRARRIPAAARASMVASAAAALQLDSLLDRKPAQLSGGQRQRVALARAIVRSPKAFLMDEPLSNLDARLRVEMRAELVDLHRRTGTTVVFVTHDQVEAMTMGQRIAVMRDGELQQIGTPEEVHRRPANVFVAGFIGSPPMNLLQATVAGDVATVDGGEVPLGAAGTAPGPLVVGIRPEDLAVDPGGSLEATVSLVESLGHEHHLACRVGRAARAGRVAPRGDRGGPADDRVNRGGPVGDRVGAGAPAPVDGEPAAGNPLLIVRLPGSVRPPAIGTAVRLKVVGPVHMFDQGSGMRIDA